MKVIGKSQQGYLIAASEHEIEQLFGFGYGAEEWDAVRAAHTKGTYGADLVGLEIKVGTAYDQLSWLRRRDREFDDLVKSLRATADKIQDNRPLFDLIIADKPAST